MRAVAGTPHVGLTRGRWYACLEPERKPDGYCFYDSCCYRCLIKLQADMRNDPDSLIQRVKNGVPTDQYRTAAEWLDAIDKHIEKQGLAS